jgi:hypothetical protein
MVARLGLRSLSSVLTAFPQAAVRARVERLSCGSSDLMFVQ